MALILELGIDSKNNIYSHTNIQQEEGLLSSSFIGKKCPRMKLLMWNRHGVCSAPTAPFRAFSSAPDGDTTRSLTSPALPPASTR